MTVGKLVPMWTSRNLGLGRLRKSRSQGRMQASAIVMANVLAGDSLKMAFIEWDEEVEALRMVSNEGCPTLAGASLRLATLQVLADGSRRNSNAPTSAIAHWRSFPHPTLGFHGPS